MQNLPNFVSIIGVDLNQMSIIHDNICEVIHKKSYHMKYHIKYHMTLTTVFSVVYWNMGLFL